MFARPEPGTPVNDLETPCLIADLDAVEHNMNVIAAAYEHTACKMRQHAKNIKCAAFAHEQIRRGGTGGGVCVAKLAEAEVMAEGGISDILITSQIGAAGKMPRIAALARSTDLKVAVDDEKQIRMLGAAAVEWSTTVGVVIEVDTSMGRGGVRSPEDGADLAEIAVSTPGIRFRGVMSHQTLADATDRETRFREGRAFIEQCLAVKDAVEAKGIPCEIVSTGESWTYDVAPNIEGVTEIQGGTYFFLGANYEYMEDFRIALQILGTVISTPRPEVAVGDVGTIASAAPGGAAPVVMTPHGVSVTSIHADYMILHTNGRKPLSPGDRFVLKSGQPDICVSRWDRIIGVRKGVVETVYDITARGCHH